MIMTWTMQPQFPVNFLLEPSYFLLQTIHFQIQLVTYKVIEKLNCLLHTHLDLAFSIQYLSQLNKTPFQTHCSTVIRVLRYIKGTLSQTLYFNNHNNFKLEAYCDSDWATCSSTQNFVSCEELLLNYLGYIVFFS